MTAAPPTRCQPGSADAIDYGPAPNDCDITPGRFSIVWVLLTFVLPKLLLDLGVIS